MCHLYLTIYPCNHTVLTQYDQCKSGQHPRTCNADKLTMDVKLYSQWPHGLPSACPTSRPGRTCIRPPLAPIAYAQTCVRFGVPFSDAVAMIPAWVLDLDGGIVGTKSRPWRASEYVIALLQARGGMVFGAAGREKLAFGLFEVPSQRKGGLFVCDSALQAIAEEEVDEAMEIDQVPVERELRG